MEDVNKLFLEIISKKQIRKEKGIFWWAK